MFKKIFRFVGPNLRRRIKESGISTGIKGIKENISGLKAMLAAIRSLRKKNTEDVTSTTVMESDFGLVLSAWGVGEDERLLVARMLKQEAYMYAALSVWAALYLLSAYNSSSLFVCIVVFAVMLALVFMFTARWWRASCLIKRKFKPFNKWMWDGFCC